MQIINRLLTPDEFKEYVENKFFGYFPANKIILHHTYVPNQAQWKGRDTILAMKRYYESKRWRSGPHLYIAQEGIWLFSDMRKNGTHAGSGNWRSIGIEMVGDFQEKLPTGKVWANTKFAIKTLNKKLKLKDDAIRFHREYSATDCPGKAIDKKWAIREIIQFEGFIPDYTLVKAIGEPTVYYVNDGTKYPIPDWKTLMFYWGDKHLNIQQRPVSELKSLTTGKVLPSMI